MYSLSKESYRLLKSINLDEMNGAISFDDDTNSISTENLALLQIILNEEIVTCGMTSSQETVTNYGRALYALYDELLAQKH